MRTENTHPSEEELLLVADGEASAECTRRVRAHLGGCWPCRARLRSIEDAITSFVLAHRESAGAMLPSAAGPRALLRARLEELSAAQTGRRAWWSTFTGWRKNLAYAAFACACGIGTLIAIREMVSAPAALMPKRSLTPGATLSVSAEQVCAANPVNNPIVPAALRQRVFEEYGIKEATPQAYEVDYLITPALGGADDILNLWPQPYSAKVWNAKVKDALEDHLRQLVCDGRLDLATAQRDISENWIAAYKRHFHTDRPRAGDQ